MFLFKKTGINEKLFFNSRTSLAFALKILNLLFQFISIYFLVDSFTSTELGVYYLFMSFFGLQILVDLGFTKTMSIFISHESSKVTLIKNSIEGDIKSLQKVKIILKIVYGWFVKSSLYLFFIYLCVGMVFFVIKEKSSEIFMLWILLSIMSCILLFSSLVTSFLQGINEINKANIYSSIQLIVSNVLFFSTIKTFGLQSLLFKSLGSILVFFIYVLYYKKLLYFFIRLKTNLDFGINTLFSKQQRKFALTSILGFFILNTFIPFSYYFVSPEFSGQLGLTFQITNTVSVFMMIFFNVNFPIFSQSIADFEYEKAFSDFFYVLKAIFILLVIGYSSFFLLKEIPLIQTFINNKIFDHWNLVLIVFGSIGYLYVDLISSFLRLFKVELFVKHAIISLGISVLLLSTLGLYYQHIGVVIAYFLLALFGAANVSAIFIKYRRNERV